MSEEFTIRLTREQLEGLGTAFSYAWGAMLDREYGPAPYAEQDQVSEVVDAIGAQVRAAGWETYGL